MKLGIVFYGLGIQLLRTRILNFGPCAVWGPREARSGEMINLEWGAYLFSLSLRRKLNLSAIFGLVPKFNSVNFPPHKLLLKIAYL